MGESKTMKRIRVLHSELNGELGGIESFLYNVYRFIDKEKVEFDFLTISDTPAYGDKFKKMGSTVYKVPKHINFLGYYFAIDKILREGNYDIVHVRLYIRDDGSSDRTTDILASYQEHKNVKIEKGNNLGFAKSFLTALDECDEADYYAFSDQDDVWEKNKLSTAIEILEEESQSTPLLYCSALQRVDENLNPLHVQSYHGLRMVIVQLIQE